MTLKTALVLILGTGLIAPGAAGATTSPASKQRTEEARYMGGGKTIATPAAAVYGIGECTDQELGCVEFETLPHEKWASLEVDDDFARTAVGLYFEQGLNQGHFACGQTPEPIRILGGVKLIVRVVTGTCGITPSSPIQGVITATFSNRR